MVKGDPTQWIWAEKYRPKTVADMILPERMRADFEKFIADRQFPHLLFHSPEPGVGKTTAARVIASSVSDSVLYINASSESSIDTVRTKITNFASTMSLSGDSIKVVILDEMERLQGDSGQAALRSLMEQCAKNARFILTTNYASKVIDPIKSRCSVYDFSGALRDEKLKIAFFKRVNEILRAEGVKYDKGDLAKVVQGTYPDMRRCLNTLQRLCASGRLELPDDADFDQSVIHELWRAVASRKKSEIDRVIHEKIGQNTAGIWTRLHDTLEDYVAGKSQVEAIIKLAQYQYWDAFAADKSLNLVACCLEIAGTCEFKQ